MSITGKIKTLFSDPAKTQALFPRTKVKAVSDDNNVSLEVLLSEKTSVVKLWENASPWSRFGAQTISLDLSEYAAVVIWFLHSTEGPYIISSECDVGGNGRPISVVEYTYFRQFYTDKNSVRFDNGKYHPSYSSGDTTLQDNAIIPYRIYGIKRGLNK